ncbi:heparinase II/III domain-containing protein [Microvirga roseola]|uniref:heparinase II/III domain-containing protein n=1 Tax=Microvirga roseola TaxID=2883126 RepID=UPI001E5F4FA2|nr:heparinase II/III family protein [Microvirga roseola]
MTGVRRILPVSVQHAAGAVAGSSGAQHIITAEHQHSRIALRFQDLTPGAWCELSFQIGWHPGETARNVPDFASVGVTFLTDDASNIEFAYIPGLTRAQLEPYNTYIAGPAYHDRNADPSGTSRVHCSFLVPASAKHVLITIRSWRNSHPFQISNPVLSQSPEQDHETGVEGPRAWRVLSTTPEWFRYALVSQRPLFIRGQIFTRVPRKESALVRIVFRDADGQPIQPPYQETRFSPKIGPHIDLPSYRQIRRFTLELTPPPQAATVDLGFQSWQDDEPVELVAPFEVSLEDDLRLESIAAEDSTDPADFLRSALGKLEIPVMPSRQGESSAILNRLIDRAALAELPKLHAQLRSVQRGNRSQGHPDRLTLVDCPDWPLPSEPEWNEDPFRSQAWRMDFQSLAWLPRLAQTSFEKALDLALSWSKANPWGQPKDLLSAHPLPLAIRTDALLEVLSIGASTKRKGMADKLAALLGEIIRHGFALSEIISQNIFSNSVYQLHAAGALLSLAKSLPRLSLAGYWTSVSLFHLRNGFDELVRPDGAWTEPSQHDRLEVLSLGLILCSTLEGVAEANEFRQALLPRLIKAMLTTIELTDPEGMLPAFGDTHHGHHHASWLRRLLARYGQACMADEGVRTALTYPQGTRIFADSGAGAFGMRHYQQGRRWGYFCASLPAQTSPQGHFDATSFVFSASGVRWISDVGGSRQSEDGPSRHFLVSSRAHNIAMPDGREQMAGATWHHSALTIEGANVFEVATNTYGPDYLHRRIFICLDQVNAFGVFDRFGTSERAISFEGFLHFEPEVIAAIVNPNLIMGYRGQRKLRIVPRAIAGRLSGVDIVQGRSDQPASVQGFVSRGSGALEPASVLRYSFSGQQSLCGGVLMAVDEAGFKALTGLLEAPAVRELLAPSPGVQA